MFPLFFSPALSFPYPPVPSPSLRLFFFDCGFFFLLFLPVGCPFGVEINGVR